VTFLFCFRIYLVFTPSYRTRNLVGFGKRVLFYNDLNEETIDLIIIVVVVVVIVVVVVLHTDLHETSYLPDTQL